MIPKFRAWHTPFKGKKFGQEMKYGRAGTLLSFAEMSPDDYILMQSTSLKDKNGVEIFEGDIFAEGFGRYVVSWEAEGARWALKLVHDFEDTFHLGMRNSKDMTLIGNIYENPEMLEAIE